MGKIADAIDDIVDGVVDAIETAITKMLAGGASSMIQESLNLFKSGLKFDDGSTIGSDLTTMPNDYNSTVWTVVYGRNILALAFQGLFIVVALGVFQAMFVSSVKGLIDNSKDTTQMYLSMVNCIVWAVALCFTIFKSSSISKSIFNAH